jgi:hypothetical protein
MIKFHLQRISGLAKSHLNLFAKHATEETYLDLNPSGKKVTLLLIEKFKQTKDLELQKIIVKVKKRVAIVK